MPSSTSSSNARLPGGPHGRILALGLAFAIALLVLHEGLSRRRGFVPSVTDDAQLWSLRRSEVGQNDLGEIALIGASRTQLGIDGVVFAEEFGSPKPKQLAIVGSTAVPILLDFARDDSFKGLLICDVMPTSFFVGIDRVQGKGPEYLAYARRDKTWDRAATALRVSLESSLVFRAPGLSPSRSTLPGLLGLRSLPRQDTIVDADRYTHSSRRPDEVLLEDVEELARFIEQVVPASTEQLDRDLATLNDAVGRIRARGGRVVFVVMPVSGRRREAEERRFPRRDYWDRFVARVHADTIHFADYPELSGFVCYDGHHLNSSDATVFTRAFADILKKKLQPTAN